MVKLKACYYEEAGATNAYLLISFRGDFADPWSVTLLKKSA